MRNRDGSLVLAVSALTFLLRLPFWSRPLDMDEGLYAYGAWRMLKGLVLYRDLYDLKPPGIYFLDALIFRVAGPDAVNLYVAAGLLIGLASLFKQVAAVALLAGTCSAYWHVRGPSPRTVQATTLAAALLGGFLFPWVVTGAYFAHVGALREFLFWVIEYPFSYMAFSQRVIGWATVGLRLRWNLSGLMMLWLFSVAALAAAVIQGPGRKEQVVWALGISCCFGVVAGWNFFPHYFIQMVPALSLLAARGIVALYEFSFRTRSKVAGGVLLVALIVSGGFSP
jgi:4-amino-4-deoxy-L-arabinose transferase-like glycosyltransferase